MSSASVLINQESQLKDRGARVEDPGEGVLQIRGERDNMRDRRALQVQIELRRAGSCTPCSPGSRTAGSSCSCCRGENSRLRDEMAKANEEIGSMRLAADPTAAEVSKQRDRLSEERKRGIQAAAVAAAIPVQQADHRAEDSPRSRSRAPASAIRRRKSRRDRVARATEQASSSEQQVSSCAASGE